MTGPRFAIRVWPGRWAVCRLPAEAETPPWALAPSPLIVVARTRDELSIVAPEELAPADVQAERGFRVLAVEGPVPFDVTGLMASLASPLAEAGVSVFPVATFDTDYVLVKEEALERAVNALRQAGWKVSEIEG